MNYELGFFFTHNLQLYKKRTLNGFKKCFILNLLYFDFHDTNS